MNFSLIATCTFGLESVLKKELLNLGYSDLKVQDGRISFRSDQSGIARTNIFLRTADRIYIELNQFPANDFDELFDGVKEINWQDIIPQNGNIYVKGRSKRSKLSSVPVCQSMTKKAIIEKLKNFYTTDTFPETGVKYPVEIIIDKNIASLTLDTSGEPLFKRGYRSNTGNAPLKETLAAGIILLSKWRSEIPLIDPFCGSGTIPIEAAMIGNNIAPGLNRHYLSMKWDFVNKNIWNLAVEEALDSVKDSKLNIIGYDKDDRVIKYARNNAENAEVENSIKFMQRDISDFKISNEKAVIITNPPYGERLETKKETEKIYKQFRNSVKKYYNIEKYIFTGIDNFQELFGRSDKKRKLYNGNIKCHLYSLYSFRK